CSLLHVPYDLDNEPDIRPEIKNWMAFARQKLKEIGELYSIVQDDDTKLLDKNTEAIRLRATSALIHKEAIKKRLADITEADAKRTSPFKERQQIQRALFKLPLFPTTTIGSFPQTEEVRSLRARYKKGDLT